MDCAQPFPGPKGSRNWRDESPAKTPTRPPQLRTVLLLVAAYFLVAAALAVGGGAVLQWWRGA